MRHATLSRRQLAAALSLGFGLGRWPSWVAAEPAAAAQGVAPRKPADPAMPAPSTVADGRDYRLLDTPLPQPIGVPQVLAFFWYGCPHCHRFEPMLADWAARLGAQVRLHRVPVAFGESFVPQQFLFYALQALGQVDALQARVFQTLHVDRQPLQTEQDMLRWARQQGLDEAAFGRALHSPEVGRQVAQAYRLQEACRVQGVPALGIAGRFYTDATLAGGLARSLWVADQLLALAAKPAVH